jgi:hypothetical protein
VGGGVHATQAPPAGQRASNTSPFVKLSAGGITNKATCAWISENGSGTSEISVRFRKADHWLCFAFANAAVNATGGSFGSGVSRKS